MPYEVPRSDPSLPDITIPDGTVNITDTSLTLIGRNYPNYGLQIATSFVHLLENFSSPTSPDNPIAGQAWYDNANNKFCVFDGLTWNPVNVVYQSTSTNPDVVANTGDLLVYTDPTDPSNNKIEIWNGSAWYEPANTALTSESVTQQTALTTASSSADLLVSQDSGLYKITKSGFLADVTPKLVTTGTIIIWPMATIPSGWVDCDGNPYARTGTYAGLYSVIGTTYGSTGPTTFKVPNLTGPTTTDTSITMHYIIKV